MKRILWRTAAVLAALLVLAVIAGVLVLRSARFHEYVRQRIIQEAERITGGRVEIADYAFDWARMQASVKGFVLHGTEPAGEQPLASIETATLGFRILSLFERKVDLQSLSVTRPQVHILVFPDGSTNFPGPVQPEGRLWTDPVVNLRIGRYEIAGGIVEYDRRPTPLNLRGENLRLVMRYDPAGPSYSGEFSTDEHVAIGRYGPIETNVRADFTLERNRISFARMDVASGQSTARLAGALEDFRDLHGTLSLQADAAVADGVRIFDLPVDRSGRAALNGQIALSFAGGFQWDIRGRLVARGLRYRQDRLRIENATVSGNARISPDGFVLREMQSGFLGAPVSGMLTLAGWRVLHVEGNISGLGVRDAAAVVTDRAVAWNGALAGPWSLDATLGRRDLVARANLTVTPAREGPPIEGHVDLTWDQAANTVALGSSAIETAASRIEVEGTLGETLRVRLRSRDLNDLLPAIAMVEENAPAELPLKLNNGSVTLDGTVDGSVSDPHFHGQAAVVNGEVRRYAVEQFTGEVDATLREVLARNIVVTQAGAEVTGSAAFTARPGAEYRGFGDAEMTAQLNLANVMLANVAREAGWSQPLTGTATAVVHLSGSVKRPEAELTVDIRNPAAFGEKADRLRASLHYVPGTLRVSDGIVNDGASQVTFNGSYQHGASDWKTGDVSFDAVTQNLPASRFERIAQIRPALESTLNGRLRGTGRVAGGTFVLTAATVDVSARDITFGGEPIGDFTITAETRGRDLRMNAGGFVREALVEASGAWRLEGDAPGTATLRFTRLQVETAYQLMEIGGPQENRSELPFEGYLEGGATLDVALQKPSDFRADVSLTAVQVNPRPNQALRLGVQPQDVILRNDRPVIVEITRTQARVRQAAFTGRDTSMTLTGTIPFTASAGADLAVNGNINLIVLQLLNPDLLAQGGASVEATIRGNLQDPNVNGRLQLNDASLYLNNVPNGVDNVSGSILFDRRRATIEKLSADTGGGTITFTGFLEFGSELVYRMQARAMNVRVRYPQDVSTTFDANLALNGTAQNSTLSGSVTLNRSAINARADLGQLLSRLSQPAPADENPNEYLQGMQFDVRIENSAAYQLETSLARDVEAEVDLRLRGSPLRPVLLGTISVNRGEIQVFGNRYTVDRGDIRFLNPVKIEPTFDMDLSTRARGVTVNVSFSGTIQRLNVNYSSDPPLQSSEIIALLAVGRDPTTAASQTAPGLGSATSSGFAATGGSLLGQAASAQISNRLQRFFGASRVKIDPTLTGVDNIPQARLTFEQQVSKDITLTYITNLNRTTEQLVRVQWDLSKEWSAIAVRDQNGLFGVDFQFRKRFR